MCYVHLTAEEQQRRGRELTADQWLAIAEQARSRGMLFLLLTGGEPLIRTDFRYLLTELKKMGLLVSVNSNGSLIDRDWLDFFRHEPPFRFNITLYGGSEATYERLCGRPMFGRVTENIRAQRLLDQLAGRDDPLRHDDPADFLRAGNGLCPGLGGDQSGHGENPPAGGVRRLPLEGGMPRLRRHVRDGDRPLRREAGVCLPDDP